VSLLASLIVRQFRDGLPVDGRKAGEMRALRAQGKPLRAIADALLQGQP
jgi:hypothetical protein